MSHFNRHARRIALLGALSFATVVQAQGGPGGADSFSYRCRLLGDGAACVALAASRRGEPVPGPYAAYLMSKGVGREEALAAALEKGERPVAEDRRQVRGDAVRRGNPAATTGSR